MSWFKSSLPTMSPYVEFDAESHTYTANGRRLRSATELVGMLKPKFEKKDAALSGFRVGAKPGWADRKVAEWDAARDKACTHGKVAHAEAEKIVWSPTATGILTGLPGWIKRHSDKLFCEATEWVLGDADLGIAGTPDAVVFSRVTKRRHVFDWKTNKQFRTASAYKEKLKPPFDDLDNCELNCYNLQVGIYRLLVRRATKWTMGDSWIVHLQPDGTVVPYRALDLRGRLLEWLRTLPRLD